MTERFLIYPLVFFTVLRLVPLLRSDARWYRVQIVQWLLILSVAGSSFLWSYLWLVAMAWLLFALMEVLPQVLHRRAASLSQRMKWSSAARWLYGAGIATGGNLGRLYRGYARALKCMSLDDYMAAEAHLDELATKRMPVTMAGMVRLWKLSLLIAQRNWIRVLDVYQDATDWGSLAVATQARLMAARAFAETGNMDAASRSLQFVALSPRTLGPLATQLWMTRLVLIALAGDAERLESLLGQRKLRGFPPFADYWRGRCALIRGDNVEAARRLSRALVLTNPRDTVWRKAISKYLLMAESGTAPSALPAAQTPEYEAGQEALDEALRQTAQWRAMMDFGKPAPATSVVLAGLLLVFLLDLVASSAWEPNAFWLPAGNAPVLVRHGEWWRPVTAMFLHAGWLHLALNAGGLWMFGTAVERQYGALRLLMIFIVAGTVGNLVSAWHGSYDVSVGASGGVFALVGAFSVAVWQLRLPLLADARRRMLAVMALMVGVDFLIGFLEPQVDELAHIAGFAAGAVFALALSWRKQRAGQNDIPRL